MITLAVIAVLAFFGLTAKYFENMGVPNWVAFLIILAFAVAAVFPPLMVGNVTISFAGFVMPLILGIVAMFALGATSNLARAFAGVFAIAGITVAARVAYEPLDYSGAIPSMLIVGIVGGFASYLICGNRLSMLSALTVGVVLGDFVSAMLFRFVTMGTGHILRLGEFGEFDTVVIGLAVGAITLEIAGLIMRSRTRVPKTVKTPIVVPALIEAGEDVKIDDESKNAEESKIAETAEDDDVYEEYFNDDID